MWAKASNSALWGVLTLLVFLAGCKEIATPVSQGAGLDAPLPRGLVRPVGPQQLSLTPSEAGCDGNWTSDFGIQANTEEDQGAQIQEALNSNAVLCFRPGTYQTSQPLVVSSGRTLYGFQQAILEQTTKSTSVLIVRDSTDDFVRNVRIHGLNFAGRLPSRAEVAEIPLQQRPKFPAILAEDVNGLLVEFCGVTHLPLVHVRTLEPNRAPGISRNIEILDNHASGALEQGGAIDVVFAENVQIRGNRINLYDFGITYWGGDAATPGTPRLIRNIAISHNEVANLLTEPGPEGGRGGGGIWGARGEKVVIGPYNQVKECADVCIDSEGDRDVVIFENETENGVHGGITTFFQSEYVKIFSNRIWNGPAVRHGGIHFHGQGLPSRHVQVWSNHITSYNGPGLMTDDNGLSHAHVFANVFEMLGSGPSIHVNQGENLEVSGNWMNQRSARAVAVYGTNGIQIKDNWIHSAVPLPPLDIGLSGGVLLGRISDVAPVRNAVVVGNEILGFPVGISHVDFGGPNDNVVLERNRVDAIYLTRGSQTPIRIHGNFSPNGQITPVRTYDSGESPDSSSLREQVETQFDYLLSRTPTPFERDFFVHLIAVTSPQAVEKEIAATTEFVTEFYRRRYERHPRRDEIEWQIEKIRSVPRLSDWIAAMPAE